jgi:ribosomal protein S18 acetylase RimI-like enzyme
VADIIIQPAQRGSGIGTVLIRQLLHEAGQSRKPLRLHVLRTNRAIQLYQRLGFAIVGDTGTHVLMEVRPPFEAE